MAGIRSFANEASMGALPYAAAGPMYAMGALTGQGGSYMDAVQSAKDVLGQDQTNYGPAAGIGATLAMLNPAGLGKKGTAKAAKEAKALHDDLTAAGYAAREDGLYYKAGDIENDLSPRITSGVRQGAGFKSHVITDDFSHYDWLLNHGPTGPSGRGWGELYNTYEDPAAKVAVKHILTLGKANGRDLGIKLTDKGTVLYDKANPPLAAMKDWGVQ
jgi:hypothetical protein